VHLVQGTGFNWPKPDHFRIVFLPRIDELRTAVGRIGHFLETYRQGEAIDA
jgi:alanine-synthesizing transaminase